MARTRRRPPRPARRRRRHPRPALRRDCMMPMPVIGWRRLRRPSASSPTRRRTDRRMTRRRTPAIAWGTAARPRSFRRTSFPSATSPRPRLTGRPTSSAAAASIPNGSTSSCRSRSPHPSAPAPDVRRPSVGHSARPHGTRPTSPFAGTRAVAWRPSPRRFARLAYSLSTGAT